MSSPKTTTPSPAGSGAVGPKAKAVICAINQAGIKSSDADRAAKTIVDSDIPGCFLVVFSGMTGVAHEVMRCTELLSGMSPEFSANEQNEIYNAFEEFARVHGQFVASVVDKHSNATASLHSGYMGVASCFLAGKVCIDAFASKVAALVPTRVDNVKSQQESLGRSLDHAIGVFFRR